MSLPASMLINDLSHAAHIVGALGLSIAAAQKAFNSDYLDSVERLLAMTYIMLAGKKADANNKPQDLSEDEKKRLADFADLFKQILTVAGPSRYQYTETTLKVNLDLAQSMDLSANIGLGLGLGAVAVNASLTVGFSYDYRAAAEIQTTIHAMPADNTIMSTLLGRAEKLSETCLTLPDRSPIDQNIIDKSSAIFGKTLGADALQPVKAQA
jgi:hypothetical protein